MNNPLHNDDTSEFPHIDNAHDFPPRTKPRKGGFQPIPGNWRFKRCCDPSHQPPTMLYIPPGQQYVHICPTCLTETAMIGSSVTMGVR